LHYFAIPRKNHHPNPKLTRTARWFLSLKPLHDLAADQSRGQSSPHTNPYSRAAKRIDELGPDPKSIFNPTENKPPRKFHQSRIAFQREFSHIALSSSQDARTRKNGRWSQKTKERFLIQDSKVDRHMLLRVPVFVVIPNRIHHRVRGFNLDEPRPRHPGGESPGIMGNRQKREDGGYVSTPVGMRRLTTGNPLQSRITSRDQARIRQFGAPIKPLVVTCWV